MNAAAQQNGDGREAGHCAGAHGHCHQEYVHGRHLQGLCTFLVGFQSLREVPEDFAVLLKLLMLCTWGKFEGLRKFKDYACPSWDSNSGVAVEIDFW